MNKLIELFWPRLEPEPELDRLKRSSRLAETLAKIETVNWSDTPPVLEEARILAEREHQRSKSADAKATVYLGGLAAALPLTASLINYLLGISELVSIWQFRALIALIILSMIYLLSTGRWALRTIQVRGHFRVDVDHLVALDGQKDTESAICKDILISVRKNWDGTNEKTTNLIMAHHFLLRTFFIFVIFIILLGIFVTIQTMPVPTLVCALR